MRRRTFLLASATTVLLADTNQELVDLFGGMAGALSEGNAQAFLRAVDPSMPGYGKFAAAVAGLIGQNELGSSIEITKQYDEKTQTVELDWLLEIKGPLQTVRRQSTVKYKVERRRKQWKVVAIDPLDFFSPPRPK